MSQNEYFPTRQQIELPPMSKTRGAVVWARPLSGARGVEKCLHLYAIEIMTLSALSRLYPKPHLFAPKEISVNTKNDKTKGKLFKFFFFFNVIFFFLAKQRDWASQSESGMDRDRQMRHQMRHNESRRILNYLFVPHCYPWPPAFCLQPK